jgi:hypothetical protein
MSVPLRRRYLIALALGLTGSVSLAGCGAPATGAAQAGGTVRHTSRAGSPGAAAAPAAPRFFADTVLFAEGSGPLQVRESATGALVAQDEQASGVTGLAAAGGRSFVIALPVSGTCATRLYRLRLSRLGLPGRLSPLAVSCTVSCGPSRPAPAARSSAMRSAAAPKANPVTSASSRFAVDGYGSGET